MIKKIFGIVFCILMLFSTLSVVTVAITDNNIEEPILKINNTNYPNIIETYDLIDIRVCYGIIINHGIIYDNYNKSYYNITPIFVRYNMIQYDTHYGFSYEHGRITENPLIIPIIKENGFWHGYISKYFMFIYHWEI